MKGNRIVLPLSSQPGSQLVVPLIYLVALLFLLFPYSVSAKKLLENWDTTPALDASWGSVGGDDHRVYIQSGELHLENRPYSATENGEDFRMGAEIRFPNSGSTFTEFQAVYRLESLCDAQNTAAITTCSVEYSGFFYNVNASPSDGTGDVLFQLRFGDKGAGLQTWWEIWQSQDGNYTNFTLINEGDITPPGGGWQLSTNYTLAVTYDNAETFTGTFGGQPIIGATGPTKNAPPNFSLRRLRNRIILTTPFSGDPDPQTVHSVIDNVQVGNGMGLSLYEDFNNADEALSTTKWRDDRLARQATVKNNRLKMSNKTANTDMVDSAGAVLRARLPDKYQDTTFIQADMEITDGITQDGTRSEIRFSGDWGNAKYTSYPGNSDGKVFAMARLRKRDSAPYGYDAGCYVSVDNDGTGNNFTDLNWDGTNQASISPDKEYTLSLQRTGTTFYCRVIDKAASSILVNTSGNLSNQGFATITEVSEHTLGKELNVRVRNNAGAVQGYFDNVYIEGSSLLLNIVPIISNARKN